MSEPDESYEVGYGKPPRQSRFQKGTSGNPKGRPKGSKNLASIILKEGNQRVRINGPRGSRTVTKIEATVMQLGNKSAQGDLRASREFLALIQRSEESLASGAGPIAVSELDQQVMENLRKRMVAFRTEGNESETEGTK
jgi:hypothetical protein